MAQVTLPVVGVQYNVDSLLGTDGIVGVKTGWTPEAGGCFLFAAGTSVDGNKVTVIGAVLHQAATTAQPSALQAAFDASTSLLKSAESALVRVQVVKAGAKFGSLEAPWASSVVLRAARSVSVYGLPGTKVSTQVSLPRTFTAPVASGQHLGTATVTVGSQQVTIPLTTGGKLPSASLKWRLTRI